jgi:hypothetical protein
MPFRQLTEQFYKQPNRGSWKSNRFVAVWQPNRERLTGELRESST